MGRTIIFWSLSNVSLNRNVVENLAICKCIIQVIVIPVGITAQTDKKSKNEIIEKIEVVTKTLKNSNIRAESDLRDNYSPGWKFNHWELKGVPIRLELGPMDIAKSQVIPVIR